MTPEFLDTAVKLATAGMSGVCVFMALVSGMMIWKLPNNASPEKFKTVRQFMWTCVLLAVIAGTSGAANAHFSREKIVAAKEEAKTAETQATAALQQVAASRATLEDSRVKLSRVSELLAQGNVQQARTVADDAKKSLLIPPDQLFRANQ